MSKAPVVILGAGLTGLSTAYHLEKSGFFDYLIFEKDNTAGGLCRSVTQDGFTFDYTGHLIHASDAYFRSFIDHTLGISKLTSVVRRSFIYSHQIYTAYPYQVNLYGLPDEVIKQCVTEFVKRRKRTNTNYFKQWVLSHFGKGIAQNFFFPFQRKLFDYPLEYITSDWMGRFVPTTSLMDIIRGSSSNAYNQAVGYNAHFYYPAQGGINSWMQAILSNLINPVSTNHEVIKINTHERCIYFANGAQQAYSTLITTMPLDILLQRIKEKSNTNLQAAGDNLICNSVLNFNLGISRADVSDKHWIYFPEKQYPFYRVGFPHNFTPHAVPQGCSSLYGEISYIKKSQHALAKHLSNAYSTLKKLFNLDESSVATQALITIPHAYVIYTLWRQQNLAKLLQRLQDYNIYSIGRYGAWKYSSMQEAVLDGQKMAESILMPQHMLHYNQAILYATS